jgi:NAD+ kinase
MKIKKALVVYKKSSYQRQVLEGKSSYYKRLVKQSHLSVRHWARLHEEHVAAIRLVEECLERYAIPFVAYNRFEIKKPIRADLVITVGGDGTFLEAAHSVHRQLMFGVNSTPGSSVGHFTAATAKSFEKKLLQVLSGKEKQKTLQRLQAHYGRLKIGPPALNEVLFTSQTAGAPSRYWIRKNQGKRQGPLEEHKSSGIWIATPAGSTAAIHSAGGKRL